MKKFEVTIEETVAFDVAVTANSIEEAMEIARKNYKSGMYVGYECQVQEKLMSVFDPETEQSTPFIEFK